MKPLYLPIVLAFCCLVACQKPDPVQPAATSLDGNWTGTTAVTQAGDCMWGSPASTPLKASWKVDGTRLTATITQTIGQNTFSTYMVGTVDGNKLIINDLANGRCNGIERVYTVRYAGEVAGNTITLSANDTICPVQRCIFLKTMKLTRQ